MSNELINTLSKAGCLVKNSDEINWDETLKKARELNAPPHQIEITIKGTPSPKIVADMVNLLTYQFKETGLLALIDALKKEYTDLSFLKGRTVDQIISAEISVPEDKLFNLDTPETLYIDFSQGDGKQEFNIVYLISSEIKMSEDLMENFTNKISNSVMSSTKMFNSITLDEERTKINPHTELVNVAARAKNLSQDASPSTPSNKFH